MEQRYQAATLFLVWALPSLLAYIAGSDQLVRYTRGVSWKVADAPESAVLICLFTMIFASVTAIVSLAGRMPGQGRRTG